MKTRLIVPAGLTASLDKRGNIISIGGFKEKGVSEGVHVPVNMP